MKTHTLLLFVVILFSKLVFAQEQYHSQELHWKNNLSKIRVISYNVLSALNDEDRRDKLIVWLNQQDAEVVAFQELCGLTQETFSMHAKKWGHSYAVIIKENGYPVGISSKKPIEVKNKLLDGFGHGLLHIRTYNMEFLITHLNPSNKERRLKEANNIVEYIQKESLDTLMLMGDMNAHSPMDADYLENNSINLSMDYLDYFSISRFLSAKLFDPCRTFVEVERRMTFPSKLLMTVSKQNYHHKKRLERIDYILVDSEIMKNVVDAYVFNGKETDYISDHYPIAVDLIINNANQ